MESKQSAEEAMKERMAGLRAIRSQKLAAEKERARDILREKRGGVDPSKREVQRFLAAERKAVKAAVKDAERAAKSAARQATQARKGLDAALSHDEPEYKARPEAGAEAYKRTLDAFDANADRIAEARVALHHDGFWGEDDDKHENAQVSIERLPCPHTLHRGEGVTPGFLEEVPKVAFSQSLVRSQHGGGCYRAVLLDSNRQRISSRVFQIAGRAKRPEDDAIPLTPEDQEGDDYTPSSGGTSYSYNPSYNPHNPYGSPYMQPQGYSPYGVGAYPPQLYVSPQSRQEPQQNEMMQHMMRMMEKMTSRPPGLDIEAQRSLEQEKYELRMKEIERRAELDRQREDDRQRADEARRAAEREAERAREAQAREREMALFMNLFASQKDSQGALLTAVLTKKDDGGSMAHVKAMGSMLESLTTVNTNMLKTATALATGEDNRTAAERILESIGRVAEPMVSKYLESRVVGDHEDDDEPPVAVVSLPDGRSVPGNVAQAIVNYHRMMSGKEPTEAIFFAKLREWADQNVPAAAGKQIPTAADQAPVAAVHPGSTPSGASGAQHTLPQMEAEQWASADLLQTLVKHFVRGQDAVAAATDLVGAGILSKRAALEIGSTYVVAVDEAERDGKPATLYNILDRVFPLLAENGVRVDRTQFVNVLKASSKGAEWLDQFLGCLGETYRAWKTMKEQEAVRSIQTSDKH